MANPASTIRNGLVILIRECTDYEYDKGYIISESKELTLYWDLKRSFLTGVQRNRKSGHKLTVCNAPKDTGFCEGTQTGPGIGFGKWLIRHKMEIMKKICTSCLGTIDKEITECAIKYGKTVATEKLTKEPTEE
ncbi:hypothetical protein DL771_008747 [Monosporascus sp. 5C6A]|nr:hypothetical protein DL771_008747 [Monosporascus sp. 5C6A]